jgi:hypothetical protein
MRFGTQAIAAAGRLLNCRGILRNFSFFRDAASPANLLCESVFSSIDLELCSEYWASRRSGGAFVRRQLSLVFLERPDIHFGRLRSDPATGPITRRHFA